MSENTTDSATSEEIFSQ